jgi:N,N'-diacetyllegionaminate synthase
MSPRIDIAGRPISADHPCYIIAEIGVNHNGDLNLAHEMIDLAAQAGADAVKFQTYVTDELVLPDAPQADYQARNLGRRSQADMLRDYELPFPAFVELQAHCQRIGIDFISTAFDAVSLEFIIGLKPACLKWASGEITNLPLMRQAARSGLPMLLSTGMGTLTEISRALDWLGSEVPTVILQCVSQYPAEIADQNLRVLPAMQSVFGSPVGFSDHTLGPYAAIAARALGMAVLEKHFTLDRKLPGPDHAASVEPGDFSELVRLVRAIEAGLGDGVKRPRVVERPVASVARKSLVYRRDLRAGHVLGEQDLTAKRPGTGLAPDRLDAFLGRTLQRDVGRDTLLEPTDVT